MKRAVFFCYTLLIAIYTSGCFTNDSALNIPCRGGNCITFNVIVSTGQNSQELVENAEVEIGWVSVGGIFFSYNEILAQGVTGKSGNFSFSASSDSFWDKRGKYYIKVLINEDYFEQEEEFYNINVLDTIINSRIHVPSKARVHIKYKNFHPTSQDDYFKVTPSFSTYGSHGIGVRQIETQDSLYRDFSFKGDDKPFDKFSMVGETAGNQFNHFYIIIKKNGGRVDRIDSVFVEKGGTETFEVEFD